MPKPTHTATPVQMLGYLRDAASASCPFPPSIAFSPPDSPVPIVSLLVTSPQHVRRWATYLAERGAVTVTAPHWAVDGDGDHQASMRWEGWTVSIHCPDPAVEAYTRLQAALAARRAERDRPVCPACSSPDHFIHPGSYADRPARPGTHYIDRPGWVRRSM